MQTIVSLDCISTYPGDCTYVRTGNTQQEDPNIRTEPK